MNKKIRGKSFVNETLCMKLYRDYYFLRRDERPLSEQCLSGGELLRGEDALPHVVADGVHDEPAALGGVRLLVVRGRSGHGSVRIPRQQHKLQFPGNARVFNPDKTNLSVNKQTIISAHMPCALRARKIIRGTRATLTWRLVKVFMVKMSIEDSSHI